MSDAHEIARDQLRSFIERIERLESEKAEIASDIKDVYGEAKSMGYDTKIMKQVIALRKKDDQERTEEDQIRDVYLAALGMIPDFEPESEEGAPVATKQPAKALESPRKAAEAVAEMPRNNPEAKASVDNAATIAPETATAGREMRVGSAPSGSVPATSEGGRDSVERHAPISPEEAEEMSRYTTRCGAPIAPASQGEAEAPSVESVSPETHGSSDANTGGDHVTAPNAANPHQAGSGLVSAPRPAAHPGALTFEVDPPVPMKRASFAHCFPELSKAQYDALFHAIDAAGVIEEPIVRKGDVILDGFCRFNIARSLGEEYPVIEYDGSDELLDVIRWQRSSRDWTPAQEAKIAKALAAELPERADDIWAAFHLMPTEDGVVAA